MLSPPGSFLVTTAKPGNPAILLSPQLQASNSHNCSVRHMRALGSWAAHPAPGVP